MLTVLFHRRTQRRLPPGPPGLPLLGNILDVPGTYEWFTYHAWGRKYGTSLAVGPGHQYPVIAEDVPFIESDIIHYRLFGTHVIVLNSAKAAQRMLEQQSAIFSDRSDSIERVGSLIAFLHVLLDLNRSCFTSCEAYPSFLSHGHGSLRLIRTGWSKDFAFAVYGNSWRERRKLFHQHFRPKTIPLYHSKAQRQVGKLLGALLNAPQDFISSISQ